LKRGNRPGGDYLGEKFARGEFSRGPALKRGNRPGGDYRGETFAGGEFSRLG